MINKISIAGYKSIKSLTLDLEPVNILLGGNGVGKSNFISLFSLVRNIYNKNFQNYIQKKGGPDSILHFGRKNTQEINLEIEFKTEGEKNRFMLDLSVGQASMYIKSVRTAYCSRTSWHEREFESNINESHFADKNESQAYYVNKRLKEFDVYHFHDTSDSSPMKMPGEIHDNLRLKRDGSNLAAFLYFLQEKWPKNFKRIELTVKSIAPFFERFDLKPNRLNEQTIQLEWKEKGFPESYFNAYHLSDGTLRFICLATLLMQPFPPQTIIIDEPELGLHPVAITKLASLVRKVSQITQIILSTQSINLIDQFDPENIIVTDRQGSGSVFNRLDRKKLEIWLDEYTLGDLWGQNKIGAQPYSI